VSGEWEWRMRKCETFKKAVLSEIEDSKFENGAKLENVTGNI
jgi:hypothetical protein